MNVKIQIRDTENNIEGNLELQESQNFPLSLTIKSGDIAEISTRSGTFSTSFNIPATKENNKLLGSLYHSQIKNTKEYFVKKDALILVNENVFQRGKLRIEQVNRNGQAVEYKAVFFGDNAEWIPLLKDVYLSDLDWDSTVTMTGNNYDDTFTNTSTSDEYVMHYINRGANRIWSNRTYSREWFPFGQFASSTYNYSLVETQDICHTEEFNPALFIKQILKKSFSNVGYEFNSNFFDSDGSALIYDYISENFKKQNTDDNTVEANLSSDATAEFAPYNFIYDYDITDTVITRYFTIPFDTETTDVNNNFNNSTYKFTAPREGYYDFEITMEVEPLQNSNPLEVNRDGFLFQLAAYKDNTSDYDLEMVGKKRLFSTIQNPVSEFDTYGDVINKINTYSSRGALTNTIETTDDYINFKKSEDSTGQVRALSNSTFTAKLNNVYLLENDVVSFIAVFLGIGYVEVDELFGLKIKSGATLKITEKNDLVRNNTFNLKDVLDNKKHSIIDITSDLTKLFNLYWRTDNKTKKVYCEPRNDFYKSLTQAQDWTKKIDASSYTLTPLASQFPRKLNFYYKEDSEDGYLAGRNEQSNVRWGAYEHNFGTNFKEGTKNVSCDVFAPSYFIAPDKNAYAADDYNVAGYDINDAPFTSRAWKEFQEEISEFNLFEPRILDYNYSNGQTFYYEAQQVDKEPTYLTKANAPVGLFNKISSNGVIVTPKINLNFSTILTQKGLFAQYYNQTFELINEGFLLTIKANLSSTEISNFKLNDVIYFSAPYDIAGYWVIQEINNIRPLQNNLVNLVLIQHKNFIGQDGSQEQATGSDNIEDSNGDFEPIDGEGGSIVSIGK